MDEAVILKDREIQKYLNLWAQRSGLVLDAKSYELGRMSVACMILSQARIFEEFGTSLSNVIDKEQIASALRDLLRSLRIDDDVLDVYDSLIVMKRADQPRYDLSDVSRADSVHALLPSLPLPSVPRPLTLDELRQAHRTYLVPEVHLSEQQRSIEESAAEIGEEHRSHE